MLAAIVPEMNDYELDARFAAAVKNLGLALARACTLFDTTVSDSCLEAKATEINSSNSTQH
jgi:hypothetical protein